MTRELIETLNEFCIGVQTLALSGVIDPVGFKEDWYLTDLYTKITYLVRRDIFITRHAISVKTINLLRLCGYGLRTDDNMNLYVVLPMGQIRVLNPMQVAIDPPALTGV